MTIEEAVEVLHELDGQLYETQTVALKMAIKALEQEPTTKNDLSSGLEKNSKKLEKDFGELDCISRAALIERINNAEEQFKYDHMETIGSDDGDPFVDGVLSGVWNIREMVKQASSVTPQEPILDKIRAEIMGCLKALDEIEKFNIYLPNEMTGRRLTYQQCLGFIDKYKAEQEET